MNIALAELLNNPRFLHLLLEPLLKAVIALFAAFVGMDGHGPEECNGRTERVQANPLVDCRFSGLQVFKSSPANL